MINKFLIYGIGFSLFLVSWSSPKILRNLFSLFVALGDLIPVSPTIPPKLFSLEPAFWTSKEVLQRQNGIFGGKNANL